MAAKKKSAKGKGAAKKKAAPKKKAPAKKAAAKKAAPKARAKPKPAPKKAPAPTPAAAASRPTKPEATPSPFAAPTEGAFSAHDVNRGHIFGLRPRVNTSFSPQAFENARRELAEQRYETIEAAARAVVERALELTHQRPTREPFPST